MQNLRNGDKVIYVGDDPELLDCTGTYCERPDQDSEGKDIDNTLVPAIIVGSTVYLLDGDKVEKI